MRKFFYTSIFIAFFAAVSLAQVTITIPDLTAPAIGTRIIVPINVTNFTNVGSVTLKIQYNSSVLQFESTTRFPEFLSAANASSGVLTIARADIAAVTPTNGKLIDMEFTYLGGNVELTFLPESEISSTTGVVIPGVTFVSGGISEPCDLTVDIGEVTATTVGSQVTVPINVSGFVNVGAVTLKIQYNTSVLQFESASRSPEFLSGVNAGVITIARADIVAVTPTVGKLIDLNFTYLGGSADITFGTAESEVSNTSGIVIPCVTYLSGSITEVTNALPVFSAVMPNNTVAEGAALTFDYNATDADITDTLEFSLQSGPDGASINSSTGVFTWTPDFTQQGTHNIIVEVSDGTIAVSDTAVVTVTNTNRPPVFTDTLANIGNGESGSVVTFQYEATDPDGDPLSFLLVNPPDGASITASGAFTYTLPGIDTVQITVLVSDGTAIVTTTVTIEIVTSVINIGGIPQEYGLSQNYPNPFNPSTTIKFSLASETFVTLNIYNLLGEQVASLVNEMLPASYYEYNFDASSLTSGIYIYKLQAGEFISSKKMTLLK